MNKFQCFAVDNYLSEFQIVNWIFSVQPSKMITAEDNCFFGNINVRDCLGSHFTIHNNIARNIVVYCFGSFTEHYVMRSSIRRAIPYFDIKRIIHFRSHDHLVRSFAIVPSISMSSEACLSMQPWSTQATRLIRLSILSSSSFVCLFIYGIFAVVIVVVRFFILHQYALNEYMAYCSHFMACLRTVYRWGMYHMCGISVVASCKYSKGRSENKK